MPHGASSVTAQAHRRVASDLLLPRQVVSSPPSVARLLDLKPKPHPAAPQLAVLGIQKVGRERTVSRVLYPLRDGDHLSGTPVARHL